MDQDKISMMLSSPYLLCHVETVMYCHGMGVSWYHGTRWWQLLQVPPKLGLQILSTCLTYAFVVRSLRLDQLQVLLCLLDGLKTKAMYSWLIKLKLVLV